MLRAKRSRVETERRGSLTKGRVLLPAAVLPEAAHHVYNQEANLRLARSPSSRLGEIVCLCDGNHPSEPLRSLNGVGIMPAGPAAAHASMSEHTSTRRIFSSQGLLGLLVGFAAGFLLYTSDLAAIIAGIGLMGVAVLLGILNRHWVIEVFSLIPATIAGALCSLATVVWKRDPTAHNLWPLELCLLSLITSGLLLLLGAGGVLVRRYLLHWTLAPRTPASISAWILPIATIAGVVGYVLLRGSR